MPPPTTPTDERQQQGLGLDRAPYVMTAEEVARFVRIESGDSYQMLKRYRDKGWLRATQVGNQVVYLLPNVIRFLEKATEENPR
jgi:hypothetical protein